MVFAADAPVTTWLGVLAVAIAAVATILSGLFAYLSSRSGRKTKAAIGVPNGMGNVVEMLEKSLIEHGKSQAQIEILDKRMTSTEDLIRTGRPLFDEVRDLAKRHEVELQKLVDKPQTVSLLPVAMPPK